MSSSVQRVKRLMRDVRVSIDSLFRSEEFADYLSVKFSYFAKICGVGKIRFHIFSDPTGDAAFTDGSNVYINIASSLVRGQRTREQKVYVIFGLAAHEVGHILGTDFIIAKKTRDYFKIGHLYQSGKNAAAMAAMKERMWGWLSKHQSKLPTALACYEHFNNILEDGYVEELAYRRMNGQITDGLGLLRETQLTTARSVAEMLENDTGEATAKRKALESCLLCYAKYGVIKYDEGNPRQAEYPPVVAVRGVARLIDELVEEDSAMAREALKNQVFLMLWPYYEEALSEMDDGDGSNEYSGDMSSTVPVGGTSSHAMSSELRDLGENPPEPMRRKSSKSDQTSVETDDSTDAIDGADKDEGHNSESKESNTENKVDAESSANPSDESDRGTESGADDVISSDEITEGGITEEPDRTTDNEEAPTLELDSDATTYEGTVVGETKSGATSGKESGTAEEMDGADANDWDETATEPFGAPQESSVEGNLPGDASFDGDSGLEPTSLMDTLRELSKLVENHKRSIAEKMAEAAENAETDEKLAIELAEYKANCAPCVDVTLNSGMTVVSEDTIREYDAVAHEYEIIAKSMARRCGFLREVDENPEMISGLFSGKRFDVSRTVREDYRYFRREKWNEPSSPPTIVILVDESGSEAMPPKGMSMDRELMRIDYARAAAIIIFRFCQMVGARCCVMGHTSAAAGWSDLRMLMYADFDSNNPKDKYRLMGISARANNRDGDAIRFAGQHLLRSDIGGTNILFSISDGEPLAINYSGEPAIKDTANAISELRQKKIKVFGTCIGDNKDSIRRMYGDGFIDVTDIEKLPTEMFNVLRRYVKK